MFFVFCFVSGCTDNQKIVAAGGAADNGHEVLSYENFSVTVINASEMPKAGDFVREHQNVLRGGPLFVSGNVSGHDINIVRVWFFNDSITFYDVPVGSDGLFSINFSPEWTDLLPDNLSTVILIEYPVSQKGFSFEKDPVSGNVTGAGEKISRNLVDKINGGRYSPLSLTDFFEDGIKSYGNLCRVYILSGVDNRIWLDPVEITGSKTAVVSGITDLPLGANLSITFLTVSSHPTPRIYNFSHEIADGNAVVVRGEDGINSFSGTVDISLLNSGKYIVSVDSADGQFNANAATSTTVLNLRENTSEENSFIDTDALSLPKLVANESIKPEIPDGYEIQIVPPGNSTLNSDLEYGWIMDFGADGIVRVYDSSGIQVRSLYYSNEVRLIQVPNGASVDHGSCGNVTLIKLNGEVILTKIDRMNQQNH
ncbi:hypothetical protein [Methanomicrobium sp. W14]|uniref:hypothetical protein n=1 Tax=Methanomicrobium sp. W14 TaxID=2817839 RepID=UPI001AEA7576|nr:hypothetical protein [Methanomicrobium sp. W14]